MENSIEDSSYSKIACGPESIAPKVLLGIIDVADVNRKTSYAIRCEVLKSTFEWTVQRRCSEFLELKDDLVAFFDRCMVPQCFGCRWFSQSLSGFEFPRRHLLSSRESEVIQHRKTGLDQFAWLLAAHTFSTIPKCVSCSKWLFARVCDFFLKDATIPPKLSFKIIRNALEPESFSAIADPSKSKIEFRKGNSIMKMLQVEKPVFSKRMQHERAYTDQIKRNQQKAMQRKLSFHTPGYRAPTHPKAEGGGQTTTIVSIGEIAANDDDDDEQEGVLEDELDMTSVEIGISMDSSARRLAPLHNQSSQNLWEPLEFAPPAKAKSG
ncbi:Membrane protein, partial [Globisporangium splendens]